MIHPNKAESFPAATVLAAAKLIHRRREKLGTRSGESRNARRSHASKQKWRRWRSRGVTGVLHPTRRKNEGKNLDRKHLGVSERQRVFARKKRLGKRAVRKATRTKHNAARASSRLDELTFGTFNVRTAAVIGHIDTLLRPCAANNRGVIGLQETKRNGTSEIMTSGYHVYFSKGREGQHRVGLAIAEKIFKKVSSKALQSSTPAHVSRRPEFRLNQISLRSW